MALYVQTPGGEAVDLEIGFTAFVFKGENRLGK